MTATVFLNGSFVPHDGATISINDGGWLHGAGLFETMRAEQGRVFRLESHIERLRRSAQKLLHPIEREDLPSPEAFQELLQRNALRDARIRLTVTAGSAKNAEPDGAPPLTICATCSEPFTYQPSAFEEGISVIVSRYLQSPQDPLAGHKTTCYLGRLLALRYAQQLRCTEAIWFTTDHLLAEGSISNVFIVKDGVLKTPSLDTPVLAGIAREVVLESARTLRMDWAEAKLTVDDLLGADEVFLTNSIMQVMPVIRIEKHDVGSGKPGPMTRRLRAAFREIVEKECTD